MARRDAAAAARLRLALAAALQESGLVAAAGGGAGRAGRAALAPLQGLDAAGVAAYVEQLAAELAAALGEQAAGHGDHRVTANGGSGANGSVDADDGDDDDENNDNDDDAGAEELSPRAVALLEQLTAALRLPVTGADTLARGLGFLAGTAFLLLPPGLAVDSLAAPHSGKKAAAVPGSSKKASKRQQASSSAAAAAALTPELQGLADAAALQPAPPRGLRRLCGARLVALLHSLQHRGSVPRGGGSGNPRQQQQQPADGGVDDDGTAAGVPGESKKQRKARLAAERDAAAAAARQAASSQQAALTARVLQLLSDAPRLPGVQLVADEDVGEMVEQLRSLEATVASAAAAAAAVPTATALLPHSSDAGGAAAPGRDARGTRARAVLALVQQLQLQLLSGGLSAASAASVADDLEFAITRGLGLPRQPGAGNNGGGSSSNDDDDDDGDDDEAGAPAWPDVLLDLLLSLLSSAGNEAGSGGSSGGSGAAVPLVPLREACESVFRAFAEDITPQGAYVCVLRCVIICAFCCIVMVCAPDSAMRQSSTSSCAVAICGGAGGGGGGGGLWV